jgi:hypothetical protein
LPLDLAAIDLLFLGGGVNRGVIVTSPERRSLVTVDQPDVRSIGTLGAHLSGGDGLAAWFRSM